MNIPEVGLETLLELDGSVLEQEGGFWIKMEARQVPASEHAPHGIRYSLTLHDSLGTRVLGYDNAHAVKPAKKFKYAGQRLPFDHRHRTASDKGVPYAFESAHRLLEDFFQRWIVSSRRPRNEAHCHRRDAATADPGADDRHRQGRVHAEAW